MTDDALTLVRMANQVPDLADLDPEEVRASRAAIEEAVEIERNPGAVPARISQRRLRPILVAAVVAAVVLLVVGLPALFGRSGEETPVVDEPTPTTVGPAPSTTSVPSTTASPEITTPPPETTSAPPTTTAGLPPVPDRELTRVTELAEFQGANINGVAAGGPSFVAAGFTEVWEGTDLVVNAAVWTSANGVDWSQAGPPEVFRGTDEEEDNGAAQLINDVVFHNGTFVAVGVDGYEGAAWTSRDGETWTRATGDAALSGNDVQELVSVTAGGPGFVAVGRNGSTAGIWISPDGESWTLIEDEIFGSYTEPAGAYDVASLPSGLVVVGSGGFDPDRWGLGFGDLAVIWVSSDGTAWERLPIDTFGDPETFFFESVELSPAAFLLESTRGDVLQQWTSSDGTSWTRTSWAWCETGDPAAIYYAEYPGADCIGVGSLNIEGLDEVDIETVAVTPTEVVVVGHVVADGQPAAAIWAAALEE